VVNADAQVGVVVDSALDYIWVRGNRDNKAEIPLEEVPQSMKNGAADYASLVAADEGRVLDLTGCTLDEVLYFVAHDKPVLVNTREGIKCIVGYDEYNTYLLNPGEEEWYYYGIQDSTDLFLASGNEFYSYTDSAA
jgi:hypothetical protein